LIPTLATRRSRIRDGKRFLRGAGLDRVERYSQWCSTFEPREKAELFTEEFQRTLPIKDEFESFRRWFENANGSGVVDAAMLTDLMTYLPNDLLVKVDIASMANSLEARSPFLDHKLIEFAASLPESIKMRGNETKSLLKKVASRLVPREVIYRRKMGFGVPIGHWLRGEMKTFLKDVLLSEKCRNRGVLRADRVQRYVTEHLEGTHDHSSRLWSLLMLELWFTRFCD